MNKRKEIAITAVFALGMLFAVQGVWAFETETLSEESQVMQEETLPSTEPETEAESRPEETDVKSGSSEANEEGEETEAASWDALDDLIIDEMEEDDPNVPCEQESELQSEESPDHAALDFPEESEIQEAELAEAELLMPLNAAGGPCDLNQSGKVDINDVQFLYEQMVSYQKGMLTQEQACEYDLDGDQDLTDADISFLLKRL